MLRWTSNRITGLWRRFLPLMQDVGEPFLLLGARLLLGGDLLGQPALRAAQLFAGGWAAAYAYFRETHPLPLLPHALTAPILSGVEIVCALLLILGLASRGAAFGLLMVLLAIAWSLHHAGEAVWSREMLCEAILLGLLIVRGGGALSVDRLLRRD